MAAVMTLVPFLVLSVAAISPPRLPALHRPARCACTLQERADQEAGPSSPAVWLASKRSPPDALVHGRVPTREVDRQSSVKKQLEREQSSVKEQLERTFAISDDASSLLAAELSWAAAEEEAAASEAALRGEKLAIVLSEETASLGVGAARLLLGCVALVYGSNYASVKLLDEWVGSPSLGGRQPACPS